MLGVNITDNFDDHNREMIEKIDRFFDAIDNLKVHPEIMHILLHFCGKPRLLYYCQTTPPKFGLEVVQHFDNKIKNSFAKLIGIIPMELKTPTLFQIILFTQSMVQISQTTSPTTMTSTQIHSTMS